MNPKYKRAVFCKYPSDCKEVPGKKCDCAGEYRVADEARIKEALNRAHDIRRFEIELYWRRSLYFWGFQAGFFAAYSLIFSALSDDMTGKNEKLAYIAMLIVACLGLIVSILWHFLEKGSKAWQENWEHHIDQLEDEFTGRLHKIVLGKQEDFYSVTKINQRIIFFIGFAWLCLAALPISFLLCEKCFVSPSFWCFLGLFFGSLVLGALLIFCFFKIDKMAFLKIKSSFPNERDHRVNKSVAGNSENGIGAGKKINIYYRWQKEKGKKIILP